MQNDSRNYTEYTLINTIFTHKYFYSFKVSKPFDMLVIHDKYSLMEERINKQINKNLFNEIDVNLLFGMQCSGNNKFQQNYLYKIKSQTESAFINKKYNNFKN